MIEKKEETPQPEPISIRTPVDARSLALSVLAVLALVIFLQHAQSVLIPIVLGILISYTLMPLVNALARASIPRAVGAAVAVSLLVGVLGVGTYTLKDQMMAVVADVPQAAQRDRAVRGRAAGITRAGSARAARRSERSAGSRRTPGR